MKNNNRGRDIFMGVVAIATLIVAIVGATLAYFSITATSNEGAVNATAAIVSIEYNDGQQVTAQADELIPSEFGIVKEVYEGNVRDSAPAEDVSTIGNTCIDSNNRQVCSAYRFTIRSDLERTITASLNNESNGFENLRYAVYNVSKGSWMSLTDDPEELTLPISYCSDKDDDESKQETIDNNCYTMDGTLKSYNDHAKNSIFGITIENSVPKNKNELVSGTAQVYDLVLFLNETHGNQNHEQGQQYSGTIMIEVLDGATSGNITGCVGDDCK